MNTIKVRPVLLPTKDKHSQLEIDDLSVGKLSYESKQYQCKKPMQFVLISLEDNEIKVEDLFLADDRDHVMDDPKYSIQKCKKIENEWIFGNDLTLGYNPDWSEKVIATQDQLSPELIQQLIAEYNNSCMQDFEIEMENYWENYHGVVTVVEKDFCYNKIRPKLNNGFVCIVKKEPITYTEEEVLRLLIKMEESGEISYQHSLRTQVEEWFEKNKKK